MIRALFLVAIAVGIYYVIKGNRSRGRACSKCDGNGYWRATRGEKVTCDECGGSGKQPE